MVANCNQKKKPLVYLLWATADSNMADSMKTLLLTPNLMAHSTVWKTMIISLRRLNTNENI